MPDPSHTPLQPRMVQSPTWGEFLLPKVFLRARWHELAMINYEVDPAVLAAYIPKGVEPDTWNGRTFASMVGFLFSDTRVMGVPIPFHINFIEVNLRIYVRRVTPDGVRRGVVFIKEIVPRWAIAASARWLYNEPYVALPMDANATPQQVEYRWKLSDAWQSMQVTRDGEPSAIASGSEEEFITEHYWGYCSQRDGGTVEYEVKHPPWRVWRGITGHVDIAFEKLYGPAFRFLRDAKPCSLFVAQGSDIEVLKPRRIC